MQHVFVFVQLLSQYNPFFFPPQEQSAEWSPHIKIITAYPMRSNNIKVTVKARSKKIKKKEHEKMN